MLNKIALALDGSRRSEASLPWVRRLFPEAAVTLVHCVPLTYSLDVYPPDALRQREKESARLLAGLAEHFRPRAQTMVKLGSAGACILDCAQQVQAELLVVTTGGSNWKRRTLGSTTELLIHMSPIPILVIPPDAKAPAAGIKKIVVPLDGSRRSDLILPLAKFLAERHDAELILTHVVVKPKREPEPDIDTHRRAVAESMDRHAAALKTFGIKTRSVIESGAAASSILRRVDREGAELIVLSAHGYGAFKRLFLGSVASRLIRTSPIPILIAPSQVMERFAPARETEKAGKTP